jgi:RNA polymerase sigma factor (sigma-70 family)
MKRNPLDTLLEQLSGGDMAAAQRVFVAYEPYLRMAVRRKLPSRLRAKFDSVDVVQSVWAHMLGGFRDAGWRFADANHLRAFLVQVTRNRFIDRWRRHRTAIEREQPLSEIDPRMAPESREPSPSEVAQAGELWERMLTLCPPAHHPVLSLRRQGLPVAEIATRTGLHQGSVHRILHDLSCRVAADRARRIIPIREAP